MSKTKERPKQKQRKDCEPILEFLFSGQNPLEVIKFHQDKEEGDKGPKKRWFFAQ